MTYVYDLLINFSGYSFYEWRETDNIEYLKKSILIKTTDYMYKKIISNNIVIGSKTLNLLKDKSCILKNKKIETIKYMGVFTNGRDVVGVLFSELGKILKITRFMIQDELELLEVSNKLKSVRIDYKEITNKNRLIVFNSRDDEERIKYILDSLKTIKDDEDKIKYLYYEWFNKSCESKTPYIELVNDIKINYNSENLEFLKLLNLVTVKNNV